MSLQQLQHTSAVYDLTSTIEVFAHTLESDANCVLSVEVSDAGGLPAGTWELSLFVDGFLWDGAVQQKAVGTGNLKLRFQSFTFVARAGQEVSLEIKAPGADTTITVSTRLFNVGPDSLGTGARTVVITVEDEDTDPLEGVRVRVTKGSESYVGTSSVDGEVTFLLADGTWTIGATHPGYVLTPTAIVVDGDEAATITMDAIVISVSDPGRVTGYLVCYDEAGVREAGVPVYAIVKQTASDQGLGLDSARRQADSDGDGLVEFTNLFKGVTYGFKRGDSAKEFLVTIPADAPDEYPLPSIIGEE
jgi:hypothetical protein